MSSTEYCNAPLCTINAQGLSSSRFLISDKKQLAFRDEAGRINLNMVLDCVRQVQTGKVVANQALREKLYKWERHVSRWHQNNGVTWRREVSTAGDVTWVSSKGDRRPEVTKPTDGELGLMNQRSDSCAPKIASRLDDAAKAERRKALEALVNQRKGTDLPVTSKRERSASREVPDHDLNVSVSSHMKAFSSKRPKTAVLDSDEDTCEVSANEGSDKDDNKHGSPAEKEKEEDGELDKVIDKCEVVASQIRERLAPLLEQTIDVNTGKNNGGTVGVLMPDKSTGMAQPRLLSQELSMLPHQLVGLSWLYGLRQHGTGGILADDMGLGKTIQTIALLAKVWEDEDDEGPHLIVAPVATLENWVREIHRWCPAMRVVKYHGDEATKVSARAQIEGGDDAPHVVVCSFSAFERSTGSALSEQAFLQKKVGRNGASGKLSYLIIDEAQKIKNSRTHVHSAISRIACAHRVLLTGTPVENNAQELLTLLSFLAPKLFAQRGSKGSQLASLFRSLDRCDEDERAPKVAKVQRIMRPFVLRRLKADVLLELPPKTEEVARVQMPPEQRAEYDATMARITRENSKRLEIWARRKQADRAHGLGRVDELNQDEDSSMVADGSSWITSAFTELRKAAQHPLLLQRHYSDKLHKVANALHCEGHFGDSCSYDTVLEHVKSMSDLDIHLCCKAYSALRPLCLSSDAFLASAKARKLAKMLPKLIEEGHRALIFSQWTNSLDLIEELLYHLEIEYRRSDGAVQAAERQRLVDEFSTDSSIHCFLLSTRACGLGINLTAADVVILHDVDFNPAIDQQAIDRAHRMGQTRPVRVIKMATLGTVDENVLAIADKKAMNQIALLGGPSTTSAQRAKDGDNAGLMGSILRDVLLPSAPSDMEDMQSQKEKASCEDVDIDDERRWGSGTPTHTNRVDKDTGRKSTKTPKDSHGHGIPSDVNDDVRSPMNVQPTTECTPHHSAGVGKKTERRELTESSREGAKACAAHVKMSASAVDERRSILRTRILTRLAVYEETTMSLKAVLAELSDYVGYDVKAAGMKSFVKQVIAESEEA